MEFILVEEKEEAEVNNEPQMEEAFVVEIRPEEASKELEHLNTRHALPEHLSHVKRIWRRTCKIGDSAVEGQPTAVVEQNPKGQIKLLLLLGPVKGDEEMMGKGDWLEYLIERKIISPDISEHIINVNRVPKRMPRRREEYERWRQNQYWPTTFHEPKSEIKAQSEELERVTMIGNLVVPKLVDSQRQVIIVDPLEYEDEDLWISDLRPYPASLDTAAVINATDILQGYHAMDLTVLDEPIMQAIGNMAKRQLDRAEPRIRRDSRIEYLCTGLVAVCRKEPSLMASMALVHSRISSVIFLQEDPERGALFSRLRLQHVRETNHHFTVYKLASI